MRATRSLLLAAAGLLLACQGAALRDARGVDGAGAPPDDPARTFYVSRHGDGTDGASWDTAWSELDRIDWDRVGPGDLILLDPGEGSMTYETTLTLKKSGVPGRPIVIRVAQEDGHRGTAVIHGGRSSELPECGATAFDRQPDSEVRQAGLQTNGQAWVYVDGGKWNGLRITAHSGPGVEVSADSAHLTFRAVELVDNGAAAWRNDGTWYPFGAGIRAAGDRILLERAVIHDNGGDGVRIEGGLSNLVIRRSWLYNARPHSSDEDEPFNWCAQPDGVHVAPQGGEMSGLSVVDAIVGPGWTNGLLLADAKVLGEWAVFHDVLIENTVLVAHHGPSATSNLTAMQPPGHPPRNWKLSRVTSLRDPGAKFANIAVRGLGHIIEKSLFVGGEAMHLEDPQVSGNCRTPGVEGPVVGVEGTPLFQDLEFAGVGEGFADFDLRFDDRSECLGSGASITSPLQLLSEAELGEAPVVVPNLPPEVAFLTPTSGMAPIADEPIAVAAMASDPDGVVARVEFYANGELIGGVDFAPFTLSWRPPEGTSVLEARAFDEDGASTSSEVMVTTTALPVFDFEAEDGALSDGMDVTDGCIHTPTSNTASPTAGGRATFDFMVSIPGTYEIRGVARAPSGGENSFFVHMDQEPVSASVWDLEVGDNFVDQLVSWRGNGTESNPQYDPRTFELDAGPHTLYVRGREAGSCLDRITVQLVQ